MLPKRVRESEFHEWAIEQVPAYWLAQMSVVAVETTGDHNNRYEVEIRRRMTELLKADAEEECHEDCERVERRS